MLDIVIASSATRPNDRYKYLIDLMDPNEFQIEFVTSAFMHPYKRHRDLSQVQPEGLPCKVTYIDEPGYPKNVSLKRLYSNYFLGRNFYRYLSKRKRPDLILAVSPALEFAYKGALFAKKNNIPFILDLRDLWPEAFQMVFHTPLISDLIFMPFTSRINYVYRNSDAVIAVSNTFLDRARRNAKPGIPMEMVVLGTDLAEFDRYKEENRVKRNDNEIWIGYVGTLGNSYDIRRVFDALKILKTEDYNNLRFVIMGDGPCEESFKDYAHNTGVLYDFTGRLPYPKMAGMLSACDIAINPIIKGSAGSLINKVADYAAAGIPVVNTQECEEYKILIEKYHCGLNTRCEDVQDMAEKIRILINDQKLRTEMGTNNRKLATDLFDRSISYRRIIELFRKIGAQKDSHQLN